MALDILVAFGHLVMHVVCLCAIFNGIIPFMVVCESFFNYDRREPKYRYGMEKNRGSPQKQHDEI